MALKVSELKRYTNQQQSTFNELVDQINDASSVRSQSDQSIPRMIDTNDSGPSTDSLELPTTQAPITSLQSSLADTEKHRYLPRNRWAYQGGVPAGIEVVTNVHRES